MEAGRRTSPTVGATVGDAKDFRHFDYSTDSGQLQGIIAAACIRHGAVSPDTSILGTELCTVLGLSDTRKLQALLEEERAVSPVCTRGRGYFLADITTEEGRAEVRRCAETLKRRGARTIQTGRRLQRLIRDPLGQMCLEHGGGAGSGKEQH